MEKSIFTPYSLLLAKKMKEIREAAGLTQREMAEKMGTKQMTVYRLEKGERRLDLIEFYNLCRKFKIDPRKAAHDIMNEYLKIDRRSKGRLRSKRD